METLPEKKPYQYGETTNFLLFNPFGRTLLIAVGVTLFLLFVPFAIRRVQAIETANRALVASRFM